MTGRYDNRKIGVNKTDQYSEMLEERQLTKIRQYFSPEASTAMRSDEFGVTSDEHEWKIGDRYFKLAERYYNDPKLWWVIALYNQKPTESHLDIGDTIRIPYPLERVLTMLGY